ncbi:hypothetical protein Misp06_02391 [Microbulbifer sp. NBRC 101763]|uniref:hypothetical protein n=1 Tax=Microbulbifer TaxID=48073 RepID=UPI0003771A73|nr:MULTISPECIES: hypothetical protein [Microbulbifer]WHI52227.1 hypothetical protein P3339_05365 [Microbulbifer sp. MLAF003]
MKKTLLCFVALLVVACATTNDFVVADYMQDPQSLPPVTLFAKIPEPDFERRCDEFANGSLLKHCQFDVIDYQELHRELESSGIFDLVLLGEDEVPYQLLITSAGYLEEGAEDIGGAVIAGATMMLAPLSTSRDIHIDATLTWHGLPLRRYQFEIPFTSRISLLTPAGKADRDLAKAVASELISRLQQDQVMAPELLFQTIEASDYHQTLNLPESVGEYVSNPLVLANHPLYGAQTRYVHRQFHFDSVDVFVYPIPNWNWEDPKSAQIREVERIRRELALVEREARWQSLDLGEEVSEIWSVHGEATPVTRLSGHFLAADGERFDTHTYLFVRKDKFIKVRASFAGVGRNRAEVEAFARGLIANAGVPSESKFMAKVRANWRDKQVVN